MHRDKRKQSQQKKALHALKNQARGAFSSIHSKVPATSSSSVLARERQGSAAIKLVLAAAQKQLFGATLAEFEQWMNTQKRIFFSREALGTSRELLGLIPESIAPSHLKDSLQSSINNLKRVSESLLAFKTQARDLENLIEKQDHNSATSILDALIDEHGHSFWAIETKIALLSSLGKFTETKDYIANLSTGAVGLNAFYLYHFGLRNEASQSTQRLRAIVNRRIKDSALPAEYQSYAEYRAARILPKDRSGLSAILSYEQFTTPIDLLFTTKRICTQILCHAIDFNEAEHLLATEFIDTLNQAQPPSGSKIKISHGLKQAIDGGVDNALFNKIAPAESTLTNQIALGLAAAISYSGNETHEEDFRKALMNYWWLEDVILLDSCTPLPRLPDIFISNADQDLVNPVSSAIIERLAFHKQSSVALRTNFNVVEPPSDAPWAQAKLTAAVIDCLAVKMAWTCFEEDNYATLLRLIQFALFHNPRLLNSLPLARLFNGADFKRARSFGIGIDLCNCLHWYSQINRERKIRTFKRFAIEEWVELTSHHGLLDACKHLSDSSDNNVTKEYFLTNTCDIATIELLLEIDGTRQALEVRANLLQLAARKSPSSAQLEVEADAIVAQLQVDDVLEELDETKVSVDEEALLPVVAREVSADFERYKQLLSTSNGHSNSIEELLKSLRQQSASAFQIPKSEADDVLIQMMQTVLDRFIDDPVFGLDAIVGRRIRHGTISDELRGTLEQLHLIGQRPRTGADYELPSKASSIIGNYDSNSKKGITRAFGRFSLAIDSLVAQLRDEIFQCKQKGKLKPAFELTISPVLFAMGRDAATISGSSEQFCRELFDAFWFVLSTRAEHERIEAKHFASNSLRDSCTKLLADLRGAKLNDAQFLSGIQQASEELQRRAEGISNWICIPKGSFEGRSYPIGLVFDAAMVFCKTKRPGFEPTSTDSIDRSISLDAHGYPIVFDALCIAFSNIAQHSGIKHGNHVHTSIRANDSNDLLNFTIESEIAKDAWSRERLQRVESIREEIKKRAFADRAKRTSGSGLAKLATIVQQRPNCNIEFGTVQNNTKFRLSFDLSFISFNPSIQSQQVNID